MAFSFLTESNLYKKYKDATDYTDSLTKPFPEFERIAGNKPSEQRDKRYSDVTDGTTASVVRKLGKRVVQQLPTGHLETDDENAWLPIVADFIYTNKILPYANLDYDLIQKCWQAIERGGIYGSQFIYTPFVNHDGEFTSDMTLPYWADVKIPRGGKSGTAHKYLFLRTWWQEDDFDAAIDREKKLKKSAKERGEKYESQWILENLEAAKKMITSKDTDSQDVTERDRKTESDGVEVVTGLQMGVNAIFYTFVPGNSDGSEDGVTILRKKTNKDPRGKYPGTWYYNDTDGFNPLGRGFVELIGPLQNLIDSDMQAYQWNRALMLAPPVIKRGNFSKRKIVYEPNAIIDVGDDPNADVKALNIDNSAVINYPDLYGLQKSQLLNLVNSPDTSISSDVGNPGFGKTPQALDMQQQTISVDDNYVRKNFESMWENWSEDAVNVYFAERQGKEELQLDKQTAEKLRKLAAEGKFEPNLLSENNKVVIDYDTATPVLKFRVDASTSRMKEDAAQSDILKEILDTVTNNPLLSELVPPEKKLAIYNRLVAGSAVEDPEELSIDIEEFMQQQQMMQEQAQAEQQAIQEQAMQQLPAGQPVEGEVIDQPMEQQPMEQLPAEQPQMPEEQPGLSEEDVQIASTLQEIGVPDEYIMQAMEMLDNGYSADEIMQAVEGVMQDA
ncbi:MAG: hypothetical protein EOO27_02330 [Comamonadaceae bacterium]|nr:MAG: hypothetical protein EOO27_02330 [Comamonadaceae bacterium]